MGYATTILTEGDSKSGVKGLVPVRTFADWHEPMTGYFEVDFVAHNGGSSSGSCVHSLVLTDIASGWTECVPLVVHEQSLLVEALETVKTTLPIPLRGIDTDNDSVFVNETVIEYCRSHRIEFTRSRAYHKNDQAWIEQKNGAIVRRFVGHHRLSGILAAQILGLFRAASPRAWRTRKDPFESVWPELLHWLEHDPDSTATDLFSKLQERYPGVYVDGQLRTLQRRVQGWRSMMARNLIGISKSF